MWVNVLTKYNCCSKASLYYVCVYNVVFSLLPWQSCNHGLVCNYRPHLMDFRTAGGFFSILVFSDNMGVPKKINGRSRCALTPSTSKSNTLCKLYDPWSKTCWNVRTAISIKLIEPNDDTTHLYVYFHCVCMSFNVIYVAKSVVPFHISTYRRNFKIHYSYSMPINNTYQLW